MEVVCILVLLLQELDKDYRHFNNQQLKNKTPANNLTFLENQHKTIILQCLR